MSVKATSHQLTTPGSYRCACSHSVGVWPKKTKRSKSIIGCTWTPIPNESAAPRVRS